MGDANGSQTHQHSQDRLPPQAWIVTAVLAVATLLLAVAAFLAWHTTQIPFPGLFTEPTLVVNGTGDQTWPGYAAGLRYTDHLVALDGRPLESSTALMRELSRYAPGDAVTVTALDKDGLQRDVQVSLEPIPLKALTSFFVLPYVLGLVYLGLGIWVFLARRYESAGRAFGLLCAPTATWPAWRASTTTRRCSAWAGG